MADLFCDRCGDFLPEGSLRYTMHVQIVSDFEGVMVLEGDDIAVDMRTIFKAQDVADHYDFDDEGYQEISFMLCPKCKDRFMHDPFNRGAQQQRAHRNVDRLFH